LPPIETIRAYLATAIASERPELGVTLGSLDGQPFGCCGFRNIVEGESAEISLILGEPSAWGRGIGQEAMALLMDFGSTELGLTRIWLVVRAEHERGIRLFSGLGFTLEEVLANAVIVDGIPRDKWRMSIKKETWLLRKDA
jgi:RimJ/RimL family protein N-acetyltransferase